MAPGDRFEELAHRLGGFYGVWVVYAGLELGFFAALRAAGREGLTADQLAARCGTAPRPTRAWCLAALAHELVDVDGERFRLDEETARVLLDAHLPEYLGGQFVHAAIASLDYGGILEAIRRDRPPGPRPDRYRASIERLTLQDIAVFFQEALTQFPDLVADLARGLRVADVHCGGGRWLVAMARRFPASTFVGFEEEADSVARARRTVAEAGLAERIALVARPHPDPGTDGRFDLVYFQYALHEEEATRSALAAGWEALRPAGRLLALDWALPSDPEEWASLHGQLVAGIQLDHLLDGTRLRTEGEYLALFDAAGLPPPQVLDLPSGAVLFHLRRSDA